MKELTDGELGFQVILNENDGGEWIKLSLAGIFQKIEHEYEVGSGTPRTYRREEAIVIGLRQLVAKAIRAGLIIVSVSPLDSKTLSTTTERKPSGASSTELGF